MTYPITLRPHQVRAVDDIDRLFEENPLCKAICSVLPTGAGKTLVKAFLARRAYDRGETVFLIAHRDVLLGQISDALCMYHVPHTFICSDDTRRDITNLNMKKHGDHFYDERSSVMVISVATFAARMRKGTIPQSLLDRVSLWLQDECFVASTPVLTEHGYKPIDQIKIGDKVVSYDETTGRYRVNEVYNLHKNPIKDELVEIKTQSHHSLICTRGHPILTREGWKPAVFITEQDEVLLHETKQEPLRLHSMQKIDNQNDGRSEIQVQESTENLLQQRVFRGVTEECCGTETSTSTCGEMSHVRQQCESGRLSVQQLPKDRSSILQSRMFEGVSENSFQRNHVEDESEVRFGTNERKQPYVQGGCKKEGFGNSERNGSSTKCERWQRSPTDGCRNVPVREIKGQRVSTSGDCPDRSVCSDSQMSETLQGGLWERGTEDSNRSRRELTLCSGETGTGQKEGSGSSWVRVESIEIHEPPDSVRMGDGFTYNLEVANNHTYVANNITVHNCHHLTCGSQWGDLVEALPNAKGVGVTATPIRGDRKGLGRHAHGYFDELSNTTSMLELVKAGYLTRMKVYQPTTLDTTECKRGKNGDYTEKSLAAATKKAGTHITGSAIEYYEKFIWGQPAITFAVNIEHGKEIAKKFNEAGVPTQFVSSKSKESVRKQAVADLRSGKLWNLVNVDLFGEGFDAPAVAGIFMLRKTESYSLYKQQIGRCLRPSEGKEYGYIFDHVGNVALMLEKFGLLTPYHDPEWTLGSYSKSSSNDGDDDSDIPPVMNCPKCHYEGPYYDVIDEVTGEVDLPGFAQPDGSYRCPDEDCGHAFGEDEGEDVVRQIQEKKGELKEMNFDEIADLIEKRDNEIFKPVGELNVYSDGKVGKSIRNRHVNRQNAIDTLRIKINQWCNNVRKETGWTHELVRREFESTFGVNIYAAQVLSAPKATELTEKIQKNETSRTLKTMRKIG